MPSLIRSITLALALFAVSVPAAVHAEAGRRTALPVSKTRPDGLPNRAAWMAEGRFGVMVHYLPEATAGSREERQAAADGTVAAFDLVGFMRQFDETQADWLCLPLIQNNGIFISANAVITPQSELLVSRRDLMMEIAQQLASRGKRLVLYIPSETEPSIKSRSGVPEEGYRAWYLSLIRTYSEKFGKLHHGWWFDSCGPRSTESWQEWIDACRAGNPDSAVAFSGAEFCTGGDIMPRCPIEDYHAGEIHVLDGGRIRRDFLVPGGTFTLTPDGTMQRARHRAHYYMPDGQFLGQVQWHALLPIDLTFNPAIPNRLVRYSDQELFGFVDAVKSVAGAVTINVPIEMANGRIPEDSHAQLVRLGRHLRK
jgi:hypothetical protein